MKLVVLLLVSVLVTPSAFSADNKTDVARCAALPSPTERLTCYDALAIKLGVTGGKSTLISPPSKGTGKWSVRTETSPIEDSKNAYLSLESDDMIRGAIGSAQPSLTARCKENKTEVFVTWGVYLGLEETDVLVRLDSEKATRSSWSNSTDNQATFYGGSDIAFLKQLTGHQKLLLEVTPYGESPAMVSFDIQGLSEAIRPLQEACGWQ
jgi:type VI secretion system protein VasI